MISCFPDPHPDELFYSICARFYDRVQYLNKRNIVKELFGTGNAIACVSLPSHLDYFVAQMDPYSSYNVDGIIDNHTLFPFFAAFLPLDRQNCLRQDMHSTKGLALHMRAGIMASRVPLPEWLRYCPQCVEDDRERFGECYWHRIHQVPGVELCPIHKVWLQNSLARARSAKTPYAFVSAERAACTVPFYQNDRDGSLIEPLFALALDIQWLLTQRNLSQNLKSLQRRYSKSLAYLGISTYRGRVDKNALLSRFKTMYTPYILSLLHCELDENVDDCWLVRLIRKPNNAQHPLHHLLLMHCLEQTAEMFFQLPVEDKPFGDGPWPCLNPVCHHYLRLEIEKCYINYSPNVSGRPIGTFPCTCGFTYQRTGPDTSTEDILKTNKVKMYGHVWEAKLSSLWEDETVSLRQMALRLSVDSLTVKRHASRLGLPFPRPVPRTCRLDVVRMLRSPKERIIETDVLEAYRSKWINALEEYPNMGVKLLRSCFPNVYTWLYRNDLTWLKTHLPASKRKSRNSLFHVDWQKRDKDLAVLVEESARRLKEYPGRPVQITISAIGKDIGQLALLQQHREMLPQTASLLEDLVETREAFAVRRIQWVTQQYRKENYIPRRWEFIRRAGIEKSIMSHSVQEALEDEMRCYILGRS